MATTIWTNTSNPSKAMAPAMVTSGRIQARKGNYPAAERTLQRVAQSRGNIAIALDAYAGLADLYARMSKPADVKRQFEAALAKTISTFLAALNAVRKARREGDKLLLLDESGRVRMRLTPISRQSAQGSVRIAR